MLGVFLGILSSVRRGLLLVGNMMIRRFPNDVSYRCFTNELDVSLMMFYSRVRRFSNEIDVLLMTFHGNMMSSRLLDTRGNVASA